MKLRTISQLNELTSDSSLPDGSLMEVAVPAIGTQPQKYCSMSISTGTLRTRMLSSFEDDLADKYGLVDSRGPVDVSEIQRRLDGVLLSNDYRIDGRKVFGDQARYASSRPVDQMDVNALISRSQAVEISRDYGNFLSPKTTYVDSDPDNTTPNTAFDPEHFMKWQFDQDGRDSDEFMLDPYSNQRANPVFAKYSGNLVVYGWLADNGNVAAQEAWVGLFGKVGIGSQDSEVKRWVALQIQPWIIGAKSQAIQYVGFNVPVRQNMQLKIMTGFPVNTQNSGFQDPGYNTLTFLSNQPCTFVGYILRND